MIFGMCDVFDFILKFGTIFSVNADPEKDLRLEDNISDGAF